MQSLLDLSFSNEKIKEAMWSISDTKALGIDVSPNSYVLNLSRCLEVLSIIRKVLLCVVKALLIIYFYAKTL